DRLSPSCWRFHDSEPLLSLLSRSLVVVGPRGHVRIHRVAGIAQRVVRFTRNSDDGLAISYRGTARNETAHSQVMLAVFSAVVMRVHGKNVGDARCGLYGPSTDLLLA